MVGKNFCQRVLPSSLANMFSKHFTPFYRSPTHVKGEGYAANCLIASTSPQAFQHEPTPENGFLNKDFRPSTQPRSEHIPNIAQTQHSHHNTDICRKQFKHLNQRCPDKLKTSETPKKSAPHNHKFSHAFCFLI
jgi:hypothetical protein